MNKAARMKQQLIKNAIIALVVVLVALGLMFLTDGWADGAAQHKTDAENAEKQDADQLATLKDKFEQAGSAEKRFGDLQLKHLNNSFVAQSDGLVQSLQNAKAQFRLSNVKLNLVPEDISKLPNPDYEVTVRDGIGIECDSISDLHIFSFLQDFEKQSAGFIRVKSIDMQRKDDLTPQAISQLLAGQNLPLVTTKIQLIWVGVQPKPAPLNATVPAAAPASATPAAGDTK